MSAFEVLIVGAGPAGLSAASAAAECGAKVTVLDAYAHPGGQYYHQPPEGRQRTRRQEEGRALWRKALAAGAQIHSRSTVLNLTADREILFSQGERLETARAASIILATGTYERVVSFPGWTLPGVITAGAAQAMIYQGVRPGKRVLFAGAGPLQLVTAAHLLEAGVAVAEVLEGARPRPSWNGAFAITGQRGRVMEGLHSMAQLARRGVPYRMGWGLVEALGGEQVEGAIVARLDRDWRPIPGTAREVACDTICTGYGFVPFHALARLCGAAHTWREDLGGEVPTRDAHMQTTIPGIFAAGDGAGVGGYRMALLEGTIAGAAATAQVGAERATAERLIRGVTPALGRERRFQAFYALQFTPGPGIYMLPREDTPVCRCEAVRMGQIEQAVRGGATNLREVKTLTRCGMGECQGRICGQAVTHTIARLTGKSAAEVGVYDPRPPVFPIRAEMLAATDGLPEAGLNEGS